MRTVARTTSFDISYEAALSDAIRKVHRTRTRNALTASFGQAVRWIWCIGIVYFSLRVAEAFARMPAHLAESAAVVGMAIITVRIGVAVLVVWKTSPSISDVAERLDFTTNDANAIATAVNLCQDGNRSPLALLAIRKGNEAIADFASRDPVQAVARLSMRKTVGSLGVAALVLAAGLLVPRWNAAGRSEPTNPRVVQTNAVGDPRLREPDRLTAESSKLPLIWKTPRQNAQSGRTSSNENPSGVLPAGGSAGRSKGGGAATASGSLPTGTTPSTPDNDGSTPQRESTARDQSQAPPADPAAGNADGAGGDALAAAKGATARTATSPPDIGSSVNGNNVALAADPPPADDPQSGAGEISGPKAKQSPNSGQGPNTESGATPTKGSGRTGGDEAAKKSRGVAPLMLGTPRPDLLSSRQLGGPDARTEVKVPPRPDPQSPAPALTATPWTGEETVVDRCRVPALARQSVGRYFERYHRAETP